MGIIRLYWGSWVVLALGVMIYVVIYAAVGSIAAQGANDRQCL